MNNKEVLLLTASLESIIGAWALLAKMVNDAGCCGTWALGDAVSRNTAPLIARTKSTGVALG